MISSLLRLIGLSILERAFLLLSQLVSLIVISRVMGAETYGFIGIISSAFVFFNVFNVALENIIYRDRSVNGYSLDELVERFFYFSILKTLLLIVFYLSFFYLSPHNDNEDFKYLVVAFVFMQATELLASVFIVKLSVQYKQIVLVKLALYKMLALFAVTMPLFYFKSALYLMLKDILIFVFYIMLMYKYVFSDDEFNFTLGFMSEWKDTLSLYLVALKSFSLWAHLNGVVTFFIYRADIFILSLFVQDMMVVGAYSIVIMLANFANVIPMILNNHNVIALSKCKSKARYIKIEKLFRSLYFLIAFVTFVACYILGEFVLLHVFNVVNEGAHYWLMYVVVGLIMMKVGVGSVVSKITIYGSLKHLFYFVSLPLLILSTAIYYNAAKYHGALGIAVSNVVVGALWAAFVIIFYKFSGYEPKIKFEQD